MLLPIPKLSNTERQRRFRERNPGYYGRLHARRNAELVAALQAKAMAPHERQLTLPAPAPQDPLLQQLAAAQQAVDNQRDAVALPASDAARC